MVKIMENPIKMDDLGGPPLFLGQHPNDSSKCTTSVQTESKKSASWDTTSKVLRVWYGTWDDDVWRVLGDTVDGSEIRLTTWDGAKTL